MSKVITADTQALELPMSDSIRAQVTQTIIAQLAQGVAPWAKPWTGGFTGFVLPKRSNGQSYTGMNILLLNGAMQDNGWTNPNFLTFNQAVELGGSVIKGSKASRIIYAGAMTKEREGANGESEEVTINFLKTYCVFNAEQISGLPERFYTAPRTAAGPAEIASAETFLRRTGADITIGGDKAYYQPSTDSIRLPALSNFRDAESYYSTAFHELGHWTGAASRLDRKLSVRFASPEYAFEELVAELTAAFLSAELGISAHPRADHACYIASWLKVLKADSRAIFTAASLAQKAADHIRQAAANGEEVAPVIEAPVEPVISAPVISAPVQAKAAPVKAKRAPKASPDDLAAPVKLGAKRDRRVGSYVATWTDGSTTRVSGVVYSGTPWGAAFTAANRLRRSRAASAVLRDAPLPGMFARGPLGLEIRSEAFLAWTAARIMPALESIRCEASGADYLPTADHYGMGDHLAEAKAWSVIRSARATAPRGRSWGMAA